MPIIDTILVGRGPGETRLAALSGELVVEIYHHRDVEAHVGDIFLGRSGKPVPGLGAVFVNIGLEKDGVLQDTRPLPAEGETIAVQVIRSPYSEKGARLKTADPKENLVISEMARPPVLLARGPNPLQTCMLFYGDTVQRVLCEPAAHALELKAHFRRKSSIISGNTSRQGLFELHGVEDVIMTAVDPVVRLPSGGRLIIQNTRALTAIDVDSGSGDPITANREAVEETVRQLRLRNIAGHILVDLIPGQKDKSFLQTMRIAVADDPIHTQVAGYTPLGMLELTRRRVRPSLSELLLAGEDGARLTNIDTVAYAALRNVVRQGLASTSSHVMLEAHPSVISILKTRLRSALDEASASLKLAVVLCARADFVLERVEVVLN